MTREEAQPGLLVKLQVKGTEITRYGMITEVGASWVTVEWEHGQVGTLYWVASHASNAFRLQVHGHNEVAG